MPWTYPDNVPAVAENWSAEEQRRCVEAANAALEETGSEEQAIFACIRAAGKGVGQMQTKTYRGRLEFKADNTGEFLARFATLDVIDRQGDVTVSGAFETGQATLIEAWNHNYGQLPVGKAEIREEDDEALAEGAFFLDTMGGQEHYKTIKNLGDMQEWSYTFRILGSGNGEFEGQQVRFLKKLDVIGVAPVDRGAGINTGTLMIKSGASAETVQAMHDLAIKLGAKCSGADGDDADGGGQEGDGTSITSRTQTSGDDGGGGAGGDDTGHGEDADHVPPRTPGRRLLAARVVFGPLVDPPPAVIFLPLEGRQLVSNY